MISLEHVVNQFKNAWQRFGLRWQETATLWNDPMRWQFEHEYWQPLDIQVRVTLEKMENLAQVIAKARRSVR